MLKFNKDFFRYFALLGTLGFVIIGNILVSLSIYFLIQKFFFESHLLFIIFLLLGVVSGFYSVYKQIMKK
ncbi:AtpZ/AtpI family protein [Fusobacterium perfoetens]|uniref:AtpZ/AtpI family protein n=1 Tax=Fusobacterium perfoetens TaxID=852 RepID=UPI000481065B|nr:AtpZ/AtpI family protein [Fusobacterium perfoetens]MCI6151735.1 AtpZ/AtpI family protein [Fusobacterium perfoetens]MDY3237851.1 AtpZ/AtpI family protein [Fusobacterium perfoetens]